MSWLVLAYFAGGIFAFAAAYLMLIDRSYRVGVAIAVAAIWPAWLAIVCAFLLFDLGEWMVRYVARLFRKSAP